MNDGTGCLVAIGVLALLLVSLVGIPTVVFYSDRNECGYVRRNAGVETKFVKNHAYSWDCFVMVDGRWIPLDKWRGDSEG